MSLLSYNYTCKERDHRPTAYGKVWKKKELPLARVVSIRRTNNMSIFTVYVNLGEANPLELRIAHVENQLGNLTFASVDARVALRVTSTV